MLAGGVVALIVVIGIALVLTRPRKRISVVAPPQAAWTQTAGEEFAALSAAERCDLVFAVAALDDESSQHVLLRALADPSEAVALAAARSLSRKGHTASLERHLAECSQERARKLRLLVEILD